MGPIQRKTSVWPEGFSDQSTSRPNGSHDVTLNPDLPWASNLKDLIEHNSVEYHLTTEISNSQLSLRDLSLLLDVLNFQIVNYGANFAMVLALTDLYLRLVKGNQPHEINDSKIRVVVTTSYVLIKGLSGRDLSLYQGEKLELSPELCELCRPYLMSKRTYDSRYRHWRPERWIRIKVVPVSTLYERVSNRSQRYSGYTKGYGESHGNAHRKKTKPSFELDGEERPDKEEINLILRMTDPQHQNSNQLWIKYWNLVSGND